MEQIPNEVVKPNLDAVKDQFANWRKDRKNRSERIPDDLWKSAATLCEYYLPSKVAKTLRLNQSALTRHIHKKIPKDLIKIDPPHFVKMDNIHSYQTSECIIEMEDKTGAKMKMHFKGKTSLDLLELGKSFWSKGK